MPPARLFARVLRIARPAAWAGAAALLAPGGAQAFGFEDVAELARVRAAAPYAAGDASLPDELRNLSYDQYRDIRFKPQQALWHAAAPAEALPFQVMFFHLGKFQTHAVAVNEIDGDTVRHLAFDRTGFDYGANHLNPQAWGDLGYAGFRVHYPLNTPAYRDELAVFLGASYFRALGQGQRYGLSARGLAVDTPGPGAEEFPRFVEFWIERPAPLATRLTLYALLDGARVAGAYRFALEPGDETVMDVQARLFLRTPAGDAAGGPIGTLGLAPLTSMFEHGANQPRVDDFRPEVHDSDGLMIATGDGPDGGEWLWRPLVNPRRTLVTSFAVQRLAGFGLMQRDRNFATYQDSEARYERRPSAWVAPIGDWGPGRVELVQLPTPDETNDNIVAYWVPARLPAPGAPLDVAYHLHWQGDRQQHPPGGWTVQTRRGHGFVDPAAAVDPQEVQFVVDFDGPALRALDAAAPVAAVTSTGPNATVVERNVYRNAADGTWRMTLRLHRLPSPDPVELRVHLQSNERTLTETWTTIIPTE